MPEGHVRPTRLVVAIAGLALASAADLRAQGCGSNIALPGIQTTTYTISASGTYCLTTDVIMDAGFTSGNAIEITASKVVLDLNGHTIDGGAAGTATQARGIHALQQSGLTIRDGTVRGFYIGLYLEDPSYSTSVGNRVEGIRFDRQTWTGLWTQGLGTVVQGNHVLQTGGTILYADVKAIRVEGADGRVLDNDAIETTNGTLGVYGIFLYKATASVVENNRVTNQVLASGHGGPSAGIYILVGSNGLVLGNQVTGWEAGVYAYASGSSNRCRGNSFNNVPTMLVGCVDVANNN